MTGLAKRDVQAAGFAHSRETAEGLYALARTGEELRLLCLHDLYFLLAFACGRGDMRNNWCFARCREVQKAPDGYLDLWAREHYKSTIITVGLTLQDILRDPEITVGILSHTRPMAKAFLRQIKRECEGNALLKTLFPHIAPPNGRAGRTWSEDDGIVVERSQNPKEATVEAWGLVDGQPTGKHFSLLVYDDIVTRESVTSPEQIRKTTEAWELSLNLGAERRARFSGGSAESAMPEGPERALRNLATMPGHREEQAEDSPPRRRMIGTRYHHFDTWQSIMDRGAAIPRIHPATRDGTPGGEPVFLSRRALAAKRRDQGPYTFGAQMLQNPTAERTQGFLPQWFKTVPDNLATASMHRYIVVDPAGERKAHSDYTVMWVVGLGRDGNYYVVDGIRDRLNLTARADRLFDLHRRHAPLGVGYEKYGQQADIEHITDRMAREGYFFSIIPLGGAVAKNDRIRKLVPLFEQGRVFFRSTIAVLDAEGRARNLTEEFVRDEFTQFPVARHDDMLDCLARVLEPALGAVFPVNPQQAGRKGAGVRAVNGFESDFFL